MGFLFGSKKKHTTNTLSNEESKLQEFRVQTSSFGQTIPVVFGTNRIAGNIIDYVDFTAHPHTEQESTTTSTGGGKGLGGGGGGSSTTIKTTTWYTYTVAAVMALCEGAIAHIGKVWKGKSGTSISSLGLGVYTGNQTSSWGYMASKYPYRAYNYKHTAYVAGIIDLGDQTDFPQFNFEVFGLCQTIPPQTIQHVKQITTNESFELSTEERTATVSHDSVYHSNINVYRKDYATTPITLYKQDSGTVIRLLFGQIYFYTNKTIKVTYRYYNTVQELVTTSEYYTLRNANDLIYLEHLCQSIISVSVVDLDKAITTLVPTTDYTVTDGVYDFTNAGLETDQQLEIYYKYNYYWNETIWTPNDSNPKDIFTTVLTNDRWGLGVGSSLIADLSEYANYCTANQYLVSPIFTDQVEAINFLDELCIMTNCYATYGEGTFKLIPLNDQTATYGEYSYIPDFTPLYDLDNDDFLNKNIVLHRSSDSDIINCVKIEYVNRANDYNIQIAEAKDLASIEAIGLKEETLRFHAITNSTLANKVASQILNKKLYSRNQYKFSIGWKYALLEPADLITITDDDLGIDRQLVRIIEIEENEEGELSVIVEEIEVGTVNTAIFEDQEIDPTLIDYNSDAGYINDPIFYEPPKGLIDNDFELWMAISGFNKDVWGGCDVWASIDGEEYNRIGRITATCKTGYLDATLPASADEIDLINTLAVDLTESGTELLGCSQADFDKRITLCQVNDEVLAYKTATLTDSNKYNLTYLARGLFNTPKQNHSSKSRFLRFTSALFKYKFTYDDLGKVIKFKFPSFNVYGAGDQGLEDCIEYSCQLKCNALKYDYPNDITTFNVEINPNDKTKILLTWIGVNNVDLLGYELRKGGSDWVTAETVTFTESTQFEINALDDISDTYRIKAKDTFGNYSENDAEVSFSVVLNPSNVTGFSVSQSSKDKTKITFTWNAINDTDLSYYQIRRGGSWDTATIIATQLKNTTYEHTLTAETSYTYWIKAVNNSNRFSEVAASLTSSFVFTPSTPTGFSASQVITNRSKVLLGWSAVNNTDLNYYQIRKGTNWATAVIIANQLKATQFEYQLPSEGAFTFLLKAITNAGIESVNPVPIAGTYTIKPNTPTGLTVSQNQYNKTELIISWNENTEQDLKHYEIRRGESWDTATVIGKTKITNIKDTITSSGTYYYLIKAVTVSDFSSNIASTYGSFNVIPADVTNFQATQFSNDKGRVRLTWNKVSDKDLFSYEIREGVSWDTATIIGANISGQIFDTVITEERVYNFLIKAITTSGYYSQYPEEVECIFNMNPSAASSLSITQNPSDRSKLLITWGRIADLDLLEYELREGLNWDSSSLIVKTRESFYEHTISTSKSYNFWLKTKNTTGFYSDPINASGNYTVEPANVSNFQALQNGETVLCIWNQSSSSDVVGYEIREGYTWDNSSLVATGITQSFFSIAVDTETTRQYHIKAMNKAGYYSANSVTNSVTILGLPPKNVIYEYDEITLQSGTHTNTAFGLSSYNCSNFGGRCSDYPTLRCSDVGSHTVLKLAKNGSIYYTSGTYQLTQKDVGSIITANITVEYVKSTLFTAGVSATLQFRTSTNGTTWTEWKVFSPCLCTFRYIQMKAILGTSDTSKTPEISTLTLKIDVPDRIERGYNVSVSSAGTTITFDKEYWEEPSVLPIAILNGTGITAQLVSTTTTGFTAKVLNQAGTAVSGSINWIAKGF